MSLGQSSRSRLDVLDRTSKPAGRATGPLAESDHLTPSPIKMLCAKRAEGSECSGSTNAVLARPQLRFAFEEL